MFTLSKQSFLGIFHFGLKTPQNYKSCKKRPKSSNCLIIFHISSKKNPLFDVDLFSRTFDMESPPCSQGCSTNTFVINWVKSPFSPKVLAKIICHQCEALHLATKVTKVLTASTSTDYRAIPCQRSEKKGQHQKVDFFLMKCER